MLDIEKILEKLSFSEFGNSFPWIHQPWWSWLGRCLYTQLPAPNTPSRWSHRTKLFRGLPLGPWDSSDHEGIHREFTMRGIWRQVPTQTHGGKTMVSSAPRSLLLPIRRQHSLTHHVVVLHFSKVLAHHLSATATAPENRNPLVPTPLQSQDWRWLPGRDLHCFWLAGHLECMIG